MKLTSKFRDFEKERSVRRLVCEPQIALWQASRDGLGESHDWTLYNDGNGLFGGSASWFDVD